MVKGHYFINDYTELTSYCLGNYEEIKDIKDCNKMYRNNHEKYMRGSGRVIKAFQVFKMLMANVDKLITPVELTDEVLNTQFYDKVDDYKTLEFNKKNCRLETYEEKVKDHYNIFFDFESITPEYKHMPYLCWIYNDDTQQ